MNRTLKIIICIVIVIWLFALGLVTGTFLMRNRYKRDIESFTRYESQSVGINVEVVTDATSASSEPTEEFSLSIPESDSRLSTYTAE